MNISQMNDTFDNFTFSELSYKAQKIILENEKSEDKRYVEVSLDDSMFLDVDFNEQKDTGKNDTVDSLLNLEESLVENHLNQAISDDDLLFSDDSFKNIQRQTQTAQRSLDFSTARVDKSFNKNEEDKENIAKLVEDSLMDLNLSDSFGSLNRTPLKEKNAPSSSSPKQRISFVAEVQPIQDSASLETATTPKEPVELKLSSWSLPPSVLEKYVQRNVTTMFHWQVQCLKNRKILENNANLIYSAPTSAGKTLVSEILAIKTIFERGKKVIFILPFVSVVREKTFYFQEILGTSGIRVEGFSGSYNPPGGFQIVNLAICTIEKANSLVNKLMLEGSLKDVGAVIVDEMHLLGDPSRGYLLELLLTKLQYISRTNNDVRIQIIGMSATLPNLPLLAKWLQAELFTTNFRPIPLHEQFLIGGEIFDSNLKKVRQLPQLPELGVDTDNILQLCLETIKEGCSVLIFCPTKNWCENLAQQIAQAFWKLGSSNSTESGHCLRAQIQEKLIVEVLGQLKYCPVGLDEYLRKTVSFGVAFHHAGLTVDERDIIENAFKNGALRVLIATSTLSSGVNLPARRVIVRTVNFHGKPIDCLSYKQMIGRAGRMGKDVLGESILICHEKDLNAAKLLLNAQLPPIESCLEGAGKLKRAILEVIASGVASSPDDVDLFTKCTLLHTQIEDMVNPIEDSVNFLVKNEFIRLTDNKYQATNLGRACLSSSIPPEDGLALFTELEKARECFVLESELHLIYLVTPYSACNQWGNIDWMLYLNLWEKLPKSMRKVGDLVGVQESYIVSATRGFIQTNTSKLYHKLLIHKRFFVALALQDLVDEKPLSEVCNKFICNRGMLQSLQQTAATFAGMVTSFSRQLGWSNVEILVSQFQDRLQFGVGRDLLDLMRLPIFNGKSARALYNGGIEGLVQLANSSVDTIEEILHKVMPFESEKMREGESEFENKQRNKFRNIWITGKEGVTEREAAVMLVEGARAYLKDEMGLKEAKWDKGSTQHNPPITCSTSKNIAKEMDQSKPHADESDQSKPHVIEMDQSKPRVKGMEQSKAHVIKMDQSKHHVKEIDQPDVDREKQQQRNRQSGSNYDKDGDKDGAITCSPDEGLSESSSDVINDSSELSDSASTAATTTIRKRKLSIISITTPSKRKKLIEEQPDLTRLGLIDVCSNDRLYDVFTKDIMQQKVISLSVACSEIEKNKVGIGDTNVEPAKEENEPFSSGSRKVDGIAISTGLNFAYYVKLANSKQRDLIANMLGNKHLTVRMFEAKQHVKVLKECCDIDFKAKIEDPLIGDWILQPDLKQKNLQSMVLAYYPQIIKMLNVCSPIKGLSSVGLDVKSTVEGRIRAGVESLTTWYVVDSIKDTLKNQDEKLLQSFVTEMSCVGVLCQTEILGVKIDTTELKNILSRLKEQLKSIEDKAYSLTGRRFSLASPRQVATVIGLFKGRKVSTRKDVLEKSDHPVAKLVLQWRKICSTIENAQCLLNSVQGDNKIHGHHIMRTATGRISMHEPNLQNIAKNFDIINPVTGLRTEINCRSIFIAENDHVFLSADYCQLEMRILSHFSQDENLLNIMRSAEDIFCAIAAKWNQIGEKEVDETLRQKTKKICYGIIYGMGNKSLAEQMEIEENEALNITESFHKTYPGIRSFIAKIIDDCKKTGFVETLAGRRRYFPHINDTNSILKNQSERQAVNTTIQGSGADIAKMAMIKVEKDFASYKSKPKLILHLHDELIYEVPRKHFRKIAGMLQIAMEKSTKLSVPLPVKLKTGPTWGQLSELKL